MTGWRTPTRGRPPAAGECHLWMVPIAGDVSGYLDLLDPSERRSARAHLAGAPRRTFVASRAVQRLVVAHYLDCAPDRVPIIRRCGRCGGSGHGRPAPRAGVIDYSVSHAGDRLLLAVVAVAEGRGRGRVGVDLEPRRPLGAVETLAGAMLTPADLDRWRSISVANREAFLYRAWTRREAVTKLGGPACTRREAAMTTAGHIYLRDLTVPPGWSAALATDRPVRTLRPYGITMQP